MRGGVRITVRGMTMSAIPDSDVSMDDLLTLMQKKEAVMQRNEFEAAIRAEGFNEIMERNGEANAVATPHTHPFDVRILVLEGQMTVTTGTTPHVCNPGETFAMASNCEHFESHGPAGSRYILGRRHAQ